MKAFDFEHPDFFKHPPDSQEWLKQNYDKPITQDEFVAWWTTRPRVHPDGNKILHASHKRGPAYARHKYQYLVKQYGLFKGGQK